MASGFAYDAPQYFDFENGDQEDQQNAERYFERNHESPADSLNFDGPKSVGRTPVMFRSIIDSEGRLTDYHSPFYTETPEDIVVAHKPKLRPSLSLSNLSSEEAEHTNTENAVEQVSNGLNKLAVSEKKIRATGGTVTSISHPMVTRSKSAYLKPYQVSNSLDKLNKLFPRPRRSISYEDMNVCKYISMAEAISKFQRATPKRFHSKSRVTQFVHTQPTTSGLRSSTIPRSPALTAKLRSRPVTALTREEQELQEYEEAKKFNIKTVFKQPKQLKPTGTIPKRPTTVVQPFNITEIVKKPPPKEEPFQFKAKPLPKSVVEQPKPIIRQGLHTRPLTPSFVKRHKKLIPLVTDENGKETPIALGLPRRLGPKPFSFEERDKNIQKRKEELVNKVMEQEKKAREFHARPVPKQTFKSPQVRLNNTMMKRSSSHDSAMKQQKSSESVAEGATFKARPAKVLHMQPFVPKRAEHALTEINAFRLNTMARAEQREHFECLQRERELKAAETRQQEEAARYLMEQEAIAQQRKGAQFKANPIRHYKEAPNVEPKKATIPIAPKFETDLIRNKENKVVLD